MKKITHIHHLARRMTASLLGRGFSVDRILSLHCRLDRPPVTEYLQAAGRRDAGWTKGLVFLHFSGHRFFTGATAKIARPGLLFSDSEDVTDEDHLLARSYKR